MPSPVSFVVGRVYFQVTYEDPKMSRPIVLSFVYLGKDIHGAPADPNDSSHYFRFLPPFHAGDASGVVSQYPDDAPFLFQEQDLGSLRDLDGVIAELQGRGPVWLASGDLPS
jgi:hypothetical protein